jgi:FKBP-type peptidyl-prolyl cis-trans isomerase
MQKFWPLFVLIAVGIAALVLLNVDTSGGGDADMTTLSSGLKYKDVEVGDGKEAKAGDRVEVHYTGRLAKNGTKFDSSVDRGEPAQFPLISGPGGVIQGWVEGIPGMKEGGKRKLLIPSKLGYGAQGSPPLIPPNADLEFDVELLKVLD